MMDKFAEKYSDGQIDYLDGVTIQYKQWWFNCRPSNTEPLLRLNIEAKTKLLLEEKLSELEKQVGRPESEPKKNKKKKAAKKVVKKKKAKKKVSKKKK